jgi:hypothetical protein
MWTRNDGSLLPPDGQFAPGICDSLGALRRTVVGFKRRSWPTGGEVKEEHGQTHLLPPTLVGEGSRTAFPLPLYCMYVHYIYPELCFIHYHFRSGKGARPL